MSPIIAIIVALIALAAGGFGGYLYRKNVMEKKIGRTEEFAKNLLDEATRKAEDKKKEAKIGRASCRERVSDLV